MDIWAILEETVSRLPERIAVVDREQSYTYAQVRERAGRLAAFLISQGIESGDRISILEDNSGPFLEAYFSAAGASTILNPINHRLSAREIAFILKDAGTRWLLAGSRFAGVVEQALELDADLSGIIWVGEKPRLACAQEACSYEEIVSLAGDAFSPRPVDEDDVAHIYYTSGTTGRPKGVMLTHRNVCLHARTAIEELSISQDDIWGHIAPMFHLADAWATFALTQAGGRHVMVPRFDPEEALCTIEREGVTLTNLVPTMLNLMTKHERMETCDTGSLRVLLSGGAPIAPELVRTVMEIFGCEYIQTYGMTETSPFLTLGLLAKHLRELPPEERLEFQAKTGRPFAAVELKLVDEKGERVAADGRQVGEIWARGETVTPGYWNHPEETAAAFTDGWLRTGDLAVLDAEGYIDIVDRKKDMIVSGGENVYSIEVESALYEHPAILEAAVFGIPDETWGELVTAAVALQPGFSATEQELIQFCRGRLASYKSPRSIVFLAEIPKTGSGKIQKKTLRDNFRKKAVPVEESTA